MTKELTKQMLVEYGITDIQWDDDSQEWFITRNWYGCGKCKTKTLKRVNIVSLVGKHKYAPDKHYPGIVFSYNGKMISIPLGRLLYCWFISDIEEGMQIDHRDNNQFNNSLDNLQKLTPTENNRKKFSDNPDNCHNHWEYLKKYHKEI